MKPKDTIALPLAREAAPRHRRIGFAPPPPEARGIGELITDDSESHLLAIARTGTGKGRSLMIPWLLSYTGSTIVVDPKGEAAAVTARWRRSIGQRVCIVDPWHVVQPEGETDALNPLEALLEGSTDLGDDCMTLAELIAGAAPVSLQDPFWRECALDFIAACIGWVWHSRSTGTTADAGTMAAVWQLLHDDDLPYRIAVLLDTQGKTMPAFVREGFVNFVNHEGDKVRTSVRSEAVSLMRVFGSGRVQRATGKTTVPLPSLRDGGPVTVYLVMPPDRLESHAAILRVLLGALLGLMVGRRARPAKPTLFLVDELAHLGPLPQLKQAITLLRGYGVRVALFLQSLAQLKGLWPKDHESIAENCGVWLNFGNASVSAARQVADQLGDITPEALFAIHPDELALHRAGQRTRIACKLDYLHDPLFAGRFDPNPLHERRR